MLTADLLRATVRSGRIRPRLVDPTDDGLLEVARILIDIFDEHVDQRRADLDERIADVVGDETHFAVTRGLAKLLHDRSDWQTVAPIDPVELRRMVFEAGAAAHPVGTRRSKLHATTREDVLSSVAEALETTAEAVDEGLYADLKSEQRLVSFRSIAPRALLDRYNLAQAQGLLFRAHELRIRVEVRRPAGLRQLFRMLKFHQLMHRTERDGDGWRITVDGPLSLFEQSQRYGLQMAQFLPALLLADNWQLEAEVDWQHARGPVTLRLGPDDGLVTHLKPRGAWVSDEERRLTDRIDAAKSHWKVSRRVPVVDLGGVDVLVPDFVVRCEDTGREAVVEVVGFWRAEYLRRRVDVLAAHGPANLVLCVSRRLAADEGLALDRLGSHIVDFASVIPLGPFMQVVERVAV